MVDEFNEALKRGDKATGMDTLTRLVFLLFFSLSDRSLLRAGRHVTDKNGKEREREREREREIVVEEKKKKKSR